MYAIKNDGSYWRAIASHDDLMPDEILSMTQPILQNKNWPDNDGFIQSLKNALGGIVAANSFAKSYPLFTVAVSASNWPDVQALIIDAHATAVFNDNQYSAVKTAAILHNIPVILP